MTGYVPPYRPKQPSESETAYGQEMLKYEETVLRRVLAASGKNEVIFEGKRYTLRDSGERITCEDFSGMLL